MDLPRDSAGEDRPALVLAGFAESLAAIETIWDLVDAGHQVHAFARPGRSPAIARDRRIAVTRVTAPEQDLDATVADVCALVDSLRERTPVTVVMPLDDAAVLVLDRVAARRPGQLVAGPVGEQAELALDKRRQLDAARRAGLAVPPTLVVEPGAPAGDPPGPPPWIVKPACALDVTGERLTKGSARFVTRREELAEELAVRRHPVLVQPVLSGGGVGVFGLAHAGSALAVSGHRRLRMMNPSGSGSSACVSQEPGPVLRAAVDEFVRITGWAGLFMIELLEDAEGRAWFMELNGRSWGSMALAGARGLHYPSWTVAASVGRPVEVGPPPDARPVVARHLGRELLHVAFVMRGRLQAARSRRRGLDVRPDLVAYPSLSATLRSQLTWSRDSHLYNVRRRRWRVLFADTVATILATVPGRGH